MARPVHKGITPHRVADAAFAIINADGVDALTLRRLGTELGVAAMAIYNHFRDRDAILDAVAELALAKLHSEARPATAQARIRRLVNSIHALADQHPHVFAVIVNRPNRPRAFYPLMSESLDALRQAGLDRERAVRWYHTFLMLIHGYATWRAALERYARLTPDPAEQGELTAAQLEDWRAVHSVSAKAQFDHAIDLLLKTLDAETDHASQAKK